MASADRPPVQGGPAAPRVALFGLFGSGNLGNEASLGILLRYLRTQHPAAVLTCIADDPDTVTAQHGVAAVPMRTTRSAPGEPKVRRVVRTVAGRAYDALRTIRMVRRQDVVLVPGTGVLEANLGQRAWQMPSWLFLLCLAGRVTGTPVALVNVGADPASAPLVRGLYRNTVRLARFRSYRDAWSRDAVVAMGVRGDPGPVSRDLVFAESVAVPDVTGSRLIGVGVMDYHGPGNDPVAGRHLHESYLEKITAFVTWLTDEGFAVRLVIGDAVDTPVAREVEARVRRGRPELAAAAVQSDPAGSYAELLDQLAGARAVLVSRFHNLIAALELGKPAMTLQYGPKNQALLAEVGLADFSQDLASWDVETAKAQFRALLAAESTVRPTIVATTARFRQDVARQLARLSSQLLPASAAGHPQPSAPVVRPRMPEQHEQPRSPLSVEPLPSALAPLASSVETPMTD